MAAQRQSNFVIVARASLTAAAALSLTRVFAGGAWLIAVLIAALIPPVIFFAGERRRISAVWLTLIVAVIGLWTALVLDDPSEMPGGFPSRAAFVELGHDLGRAPHVLRSATVPVPPLGAALVLAVLATLLAALATELLAREIAAPIGAIGPSVALYVSLSALGSGRWALTTACFALAVVTYLVALHYAELAARRTWFASSRNRRSQLTTGGLLAGVLAVGAAIAIGPTLPGARGAAWINYRSLGGGTASTLNTPSPLVSVGAKLNSKLSATEVFTVRTSNAKPYRWRVIALDQFSNDYWGLSSDRRSAAQLERPTNQSGSTLVTQTFSLGAIDPLWLPAAYRPVRISLAGANVLPDSASLFLQGRPLSKVRYTVTSEVDDPSSAALEAVTFNDLSAQSADAELPNSFSSRARKLAQQVTKDSATPFDKASALESYFQRSGNFTYDTSVDLGASPHALDRFLFDTRRGFCEQFAAAFAELARSVGLPTRIAVGYTEGVYHPNDGSFHVAEKDAHAWPEVWLGPKIGWYAFEPTPGRFDPVTGRGDPNGNTSTPASSTTTSTTIAGGITTPASVTPPKQDPDLNHINVQSSGSGTHSSGAAHLLVALLVVFALLLLLAIGTLVTLVLAAVLRTRRRRHDPDSRRRVLGAWTEALERLSAAGVIRRPSATALEFALRQAPAEGAGSAGPPLMDLARRHTSAMYAAEPPTAEDADAAWADVDAINAALRRETGTAARVRAWLRPGRTMRPAH